MLLEPRHSLDISSGAVAARAFGLMNDAEMTYTLISGIAKDKLGYMIREVSSNAQDYSPKDRPFDLFLPTFLNPAIKWRDYGPSMDHEFVMNRATTIGDSGSREFDNKLGGFGLGSKSPFGYLIATSTDGGGSFTMRCFQKGIVRTYIMAISKEGMPECRFYGETTTDEPDGTEISLPIRRSDIGIVQNTAEKILWTFEPRPNVIPAPTNWKPLEDCTTEQGEGWRMLANDTPLGKRPWVRMGSVAYPIEFDQFDVMDPLRNWPWKNAPILFDVPIGTFKPIRSREALEYTDATKVKLASVLSTFEKSLATKIGDKVSSLPSYLSACGHVHDLWTQTSAVARLVDQNLIKFKEEPLQLKFKGSRSDFTFMIINELSTYYGYEASGLIQKNWGGGRATEWTITAKDLASIKSVALHASNRVVERINFAKLETPILLLKGDKAKAFAEKLGLPVTDLSTVKLPATARQKRSANIKSLDVLTSASSEFKLEDINLDEGGLFVFKPDDQSRRARTKYVLKSVDSNDGIINTSDFTQLMRLVHDCGYLHSKVVVFSKKAPPPENKGWTCYHDYLKTTVLPCIDMAKADEVAVRAQGIDVHTKRLLVLRKAFQPSELPKPFSDFLDEVETVQARVKQPISSDDEKLLYMVRKLRAHLVMPTTSDRTQSQLLSSKLEALTQAHPVFGHIINYMGYYEDRVHPHSLAPLQEYFKLLLNQKV